jgi:HSP20 family molecular chaperone IbpA
MQHLDQALKDLRQLHEQITHTPAPQIGPQAFLPFPPGVDPIAFAMREVTQLKQMCQGQAAMTQPDWVPRVNIFGADACVLILIEIPGVDRDDVTVTAMGPELIVRGHRAQPVMDATLRPFVIEHLWGAFERRFPLPAWCDPSDICARYSHGMLEITLASRRDETCGSEIRVEVE